MKKMIEKKKKNKPFDYQAGETFALTGKEDDTVNNSYYFSAHDTKSDESLYCRLGVRNCHSEVWFYYAKDGKRYVCKTLLFPDNPPLKVWREGEDTWKVAFDGDLTDKDGQIKKAVFLGTFTSTQPPIDFFSDMPSVRTAKAMAAEKWNKAFFAEMQNNNQVHYEQTGVLQGVLKIGNEVDVQISLPCVRDHSYGKRDWNYMNNHLWLMAVNETSQLNFSMVSYPTMTLEVGNFKPSDKPMAYVLQATYNRKKMAQGNVPQTLSIVLTLDNKTQITVGVEKTDEEVYSFQNGEYCLIEGIASFSIDGVSYRGIFEMGFNQDKNRWFNGKDIRKLKI